MRQQFATMRPNSLPDKGLKMRQDITDLDRQIVQLDAIVKRTNPHYKPPSPGGTAASKEVSLNAPRTTVALDNLPGQDPKAAHTNENWQKFREGLANTAAGMWNAATNYWA